MKWIFNYSTIMDIFGCKLYYNIYVEVLLHSLAAASTRRSVEVSLMLAHLLQRWSIIEPTLGERLVFTNGCSAGALVWWLKCYFPFYGIWKLTRYNAQWIVYLTMLTRRNLDKNVDSSFFIYGYYCTSFHLMYRWSP